jgi:predicted dehydrogenase
MKKTVKGSYREREREKDNLATVGVMGLGQMGILHAAISNSLPGHNVAAICDNDSFLLKLARKITPSLNFYSDYQDMLRKESLDALYICTPVQTHYQLAHDILRTNGKQLALFVEKPLASNYSEASKMVADSKNSQAITMVGYQKRFEGVFRKAKELFEAQALGEVSFFRAHFFGSTVFGEKQGWKFQKGTGGATLEYGVHLLDLLIWYFGEPVSVRSLKQSLFSSTVEDYVLASVEFSGGVRGSVEIGWSMRNFSVPELAIEAHGKHGSMVVTEDRIVVLLDRPAAGLEEGSHVFSASALDGPVPFLIAHPENVLQERFFLDCVEKKTRPQQQDFEDAARVNKFVDLIVQG